MEAAADLVVHAPGGHSNEGLLGHRPRLRVAGPHPVPQKQLEAHRRRELRRAPEASLVGVVLPLEHAHGRGDDTLGRRRRLTRARRCFAASFEMPQHLVGRRLELFAPVAPCRRNRGEHLRKSGPSPARRRREVRASVERLAIRRQEDRQRPPALSRHRLDGLHVDVVDVRPFLSVHLDRHEVAVQDLGDRRGLEGFVLHDVAPVARRVADREEDRLLLGARLREGLLAPRIPVDRVVLVLEEVGRGLEG